MKKRLSKGVKILAWFFVFVPLLYVSGYIIESRESNMSIFEVMVRDSLKDYGVLLPRYFFMIAIVTDAILLFLTFLAGVLILRKIKAGRILIIISFYFTILITIATAIFFVIKDYPLKKILIDSPWEIILSVFVICFFTCKSVKEQFKPEILVDETITSKVNLDGLIKLLVAKHIISEKELKELAGDTRDSCDLEDRKGT